MDKAYRVVYTNGAGEKFANIWGNKREATKELKRFHESYKPFEWLSFYDELNLTVNKISYITRAEIEEA